jgi:multidrug efflux pump subunit AcrB
VLLPFLYLQGNARAAFVPFAAAFVIALGWSVVAALLIVPAVGRGMNPKGAGRRESQGGGGSTVPARGYRRVVLRSLRWRWVTLTAAVVLVAGSGYLFIAKVPRSSFGNWGDRRTTLSVGLSFPRGSDPATLDAAMREFEALVVGRPEVEQVRASSRGAASAQMSVLFTRAGGFTAVPLELQELLTQRAVLVGGASVSVFGEGPGFSSGGGGGGFASFRMQVKGFSYSGVQRIAEDIKARLEGITRVRDVRITSGGWFGSEKGYQVTLTPDRAALARYGLTAAQLTQAVSREVRGPVGRQLLEVGGDELPVTVKAAGARERSLDELQVAQVPTATNAPVRLGDVALVSEREALTTVVREDQQYLRQVSYDFRGPARLARRTHTAFMKALSAPAGYAIVDLSEGSPFEQDQSERGLWLVFAIGIALVVLAVALVFDSVWGAVVVFLSLPLALTGVVAAFVLAGAPFTREAAVGVILVVGLAVNQAILLVDAALERRRATGSLTARDVVHATRDRAGMIVLVTLAALASLVPLSVGTGATTLFGAIALATAGGTLAGTITVLLFVPAMMVGRRHDLHRRRIGPPRGVV